VSISLGVLNLLPVPVLDGGHLLYYLIELVKGSPLSESLQHMGQQVGIVVLLLLMGLALFNDFNRLLG
jgi:regulator of sigma E protease